ncbi:MAG: sigma-70 family RNA polymerase sigma factor, partial [Nitrospinota bacterium]|nr:sigma-70 family RNA polymerase sigma factor [Nitrospinota bacterium]
AMDDERLMVQMAARGDTMAFEKLFDKYQNFVWSVAFRMTYRHDSAEDLAQEVFLMAWRKLPAFEGKSAFSTWLYRITVNTTLNWRRSAGRYVSLPEPGGWEPGDPANDHAPERAAMARDAERILARLLDRLEDDRRLVFILREIEGLSYDEIAEATSWPVGTVRSRLARARDQLAVMAREMEEQS